MYNSVDKDDPVTLSAGHERVCGGVDDADGDVTKNKFNTVCGTGHFQQ